MKHNNEIPRSSIQKRPIVLFYDQQNMAAWQWAAQPTVATLNRNVVTAIRGGGGGLWEAVQEWSTRGTGALLEGKYLRKKSLSRREERQREERREEECSTDTCTTKWPTLAA